MTRRNIYEIITGAGINIVNEYNRINLLFESNKYGDSVRDMIKKAFFAFPKTFKGRTITLEDFDETYGFRKKSEMEIITLDDLLERCEYMINLSAHMKKCFAGLLDDDEEYQIRLLIETIQDCIDELGFMTISKGEFIICVEKDAAAVAVAEIVTDQLSFAILEYNHYRLKGNLVKKQSILKEMADNLEPERRQLRQINNTLETQLFQLLNKFVRHSHSQTPYIGTLDKKRLEEIYDDIYQLWLLAKLEIDNIERKARMREILEKINS